MAKRKSETQLKDQDRSPSSSPKSTQIETLNALSHSDFTTRFFTPHPSRTFYSHNNKPMINISLYFARDLPSTLHDLCFKLIETTSRQDYEPSSFGWHPQRKKREMKEIEMRYLLLFTSNNDSDSDDAPQFAGFLSFMFTHDSSPVVPVLYIYEIHLQDAVRGTGLGGFLMRVMEEVARDAGVEKVMLTCFVRNENALAFYRKLGYEVDGCSPGNRRMRWKIVKTDYVILSKRVVVAGSGAEEEGGDRVMGAAEVYDDQC